MIKPSLDELLKQIPNQYELVEAAVKRALEISGKMKLTGETTADIINQALQDIAEGKVKVVHPRKKKEEKEEEKK